MTAVDILLTIGRFRIHWVKNRRFGWDDYFNGIALVFLLGFIITYQLFLPIEYNAQLFYMGLSDHPPTDQDVVLDMKLNVANSALFFCVIYSVKASFLALYWQIFAVSKKFRVIWVLLGVYTVLCFLVSLLAYFWNCGRPHDVINQGKKIKSHTDAC
jgi:hypothetical protein